MKAVVMCLHTGVTQKFSWPRAFSTGRAESYLAGNISGWVTATPPAAHRDEESEDDRAEDERNQNIGPKLPSSSSNLASSSSPGLHTGQEDGGQQEVDSKHRPHDRDPLTTRQPDVDKLDMRLNILIKTIEKVQVQMFSWSISNV